MAIDFTQGRNGTWNAAGNAPGNEDAYSDTSSELTELQSDEFPRYFDERSGRLFHSHGRSPYPLPVDADEQHRQNRQHVLLYNLLGAHYVGPVEDVLRLTSGRQRRAIDLGTGTGKWVMDVAAQFPHVRFSGLDIVPIQTRHPLNNVWFEMHDLGERLGYDNGTIDLVHSRDVHLAVRDFPRLLAEVARVLRHGGLYISGEWGAYPTMADGSPLCESAPHTYRFFNMINYAFRQNRIASVATRIEDWLVQSGAFVHINARPGLRVPIVGRDRHLQRSERRFRAMGVFATSLQLWLVEKGYLARETVQAMVNNFLCEADNVPGIEFTYYLVHARRA